MNNKKLIFKIISISFIIALFVSIFTIQSFAAVLNDTKEAFTLEATSNTQEISLTWNQGFIKTPSKSAPAFDLSTSAGCGYTDVIQITKKGTEITFEDNDSPLPFTGYVISSWKWDNNHWVGNIDAANYAGATEGKTFVQSTVDGKTTYKYISSEDNEYIRISYKLGPNEEKFPTINYKLTDEIGTFQKELNIENSPAIFKEDGTIDNIIWSYGAVNSDTVANGYSNNVNTTTANHAYSSVIVVPKKGTTIGYTVSKPFATEIIYAFSVWSKDEGQNKYVFDESAHAFYAYGSQDKLTYLDDQFMFSLVDNNNDTVSLFYKTQKDNEAVRLCYRTELTNGELPETFPIVHWYSFETDYLSGLRMSEIFKPYSFHASNDVDFQYRLYTPMNYDPNKSYPIVLFLHGAGQRSDDNHTSLTLGIIEPFKDPNNPIYESIVIVPQCPERYTWGDYEPDLNDRQKKELKEAKDIAAIMDLIENLKDNYNVDSDRIYVTGLSMGGYGTWRWLYTHPDKIAAGIVLCGGCEPEYAPVLKDIPIKIFHGTRDTSVPISEDRQIYDAILAIGGNKVEFKSIIGGGHGIWDVVYQTEGLFDWLFEQKLSDRLGSSDPTDPGTDPTDPNPADTDSGKTDPSEDPTPDKDNDNIIVPIIIAISCLAVVGIVILVLIKKKKA